RHAHSDLDLTPPRLNGLLELPLRLEARLVAAGTRLPAGLSLLAVLRRSALHEAVVQEAMVDDDALHEAAA
ncbi:MAG: hypothetical protein QOC54_2780, partial [Baekduia sp.]|nr:hypothetical protein [Baekduia sp.]